MRRTLTRTCNVCEAMCGMLVTVEDGRIVDLRGTAVLNGTPVTVTAR